MSTPHPGLYRKGRYWYYFVTAHGQRAHGSTRATDLLTARRIMEEKRKDLLDGLLKRPTKVRTVEELVETWLRLNRTTFSQVHLKTAGCGLRRWALPVVGKIAANRVTNAHVLELRARMLEAGCSATYANSTVKNLKAVFNFALSLGYVGEVPFRVKKLKVQKQPRATIPAEQVQPFLACVDRNTKNPHIRVIIRAMLGLGLREAEALGMRWNWLDPASRCYEVGKSKGKTTRIIPVPDWLWSEIYQMGKPVLSEWLFPASDGKPHRAQFCKKVLQRVCAELNLISITAHRLRATFATLLSQTGCPISEVQAMLGHRSVATTQLYIETSLDTKRRAQDNLSQKLGLA